MTRHLSTAFLLAAVACRSAPEHPPPPAEFLLAAGDSTFWVTSDTGGIGMRASPIYLAHFENRLFEVYAADDDRSYYDAVMVGLRVYRRDLLTGDSVLVYEDRMIPEIAERYAASHPDQQPLGPDEEAAEEPRTIATAEVEFLELHGPYLSFEEHTDIDSDVAEHVHAVRRGVIDLRSGRRAGVREIFGDTVGARLLARGRAEFGATLDSVLAARGELARRAAQAIPDLAFDPQSFSLSNRGKIPVVEFLVPGARDRAGGLALPLPAIEASAPPWWREIDERLPSSGGADTDEWRRERYTVRARYLPAGDTVRIALADTAREWAVGAVPAPASRILWLDAPPIDSRWRRALARAFDEASLYTDDARVARRDGATPLLLVHQRLTPPPRAVRQPPASRRRSAH